ncbi:MAG: DUF4474 domain-containing protein [Clostridia bacterium]|nr:DUF4474 domain-containing protein [Clostridia bacterium]
MFRRVSGTVTAFLLLISICCVNVFASEPTVREYPFNVCYDESTCRIYNKNGRGFLFGFDYDKDDNYWYAAVNAWQRAFGYSKHYDNLAFLIGCYYDTVRVTFEYKDKEWLVQYWKGIYGYTSGAEIGVYYRPVGSDGSFYKCVDNDDMPKMSLSVKRGDEVFFAQPRQEHWWLTGFVLPSRAEAEELTCEMIIDNGDAEFAKRLSDGLKSQGYSESATVKKLGTQVVFIW